MGTTNPATLVPELTDIGGGFNVQDYDGRNFLISFDFAAGGTNLVDLGERPFAVRFQMNAFPVGLQRVE